MIFYKELAKRIKDLLGEKYDETIKPYADNVNEKRAEGESYDAIERGYRFSILGAARTHIALNQVAVYEQKMKDKKKKKD